MNTSSSKEWLKSGEGIEHVMRLISDQPRLSRRGLSRTLCQELEWFDDLGRLKEMSCRKALGKLEQLGVVSLPPALHRVAKRRVLTAPAIPAIGGTLAELGVIELCPIRGGTAQSELWNALMDTYHPQGGGPLCGAQIRYLIVSAVHGVIGGLAVSSGAWRLAARDRWLGWDDAGRGAQFQGIVNNSRFLILPTVTVKHLASYVLGRLTRRIGADWQARYGTTPWLMETYVEVARSGTCYRAANWIEVGLTSGRGRQDSDGNAGLAQKRVFLYPLCQKTVNRLRGTPAAAPANWLRREFGGAKFGDRRLEARLLDLAGAFFGQPMASIPGACGSAALTKAAYRFFDNKRVSMDKIIEPHRQATLDRMRHEPVVLVVQDTTSLNYTTHRAMRGLGPIARRTDGAQGLMLHNTQAFTPGGLPLGIVDVEVWARDAETLGTHKHRERAPIEEKESYKWIAPLQVIAGGAEQCPASKLVVTADREADIFEFLVAVKQHKLDLLVRAKQDRLLEIEGGTRMLWQHMAGLSVSGQIEIAVPRHKDTPARQATMGLRFAPVVLLPPTGLRRLGPVAVWAVQSKEISIPPDGVAPLEWTLLTTVPVQTVADAVERVQWYTKRWGIEVFHRILKSGCGIEDRQLGNDDRLEACLAIDMVVAWRIQQLTHLGRVTPELPCTAVFSEYEWKAVQVFRNKTSPPEEPPNLGQMVLHVAQLGGFLGRKSDGNPGTEVMWKGLQRMADIALTYEATMGLQPSDNENRNGLAPPPRQRHPRRSRT